MVPQALKDFKALLGLEGPQGTTAPEERGENQGNQDQEEAWVLQVLMVIQADGVKMGSALMAPQARQAVLAPLDSRDPVGLPLLGILV